MSAALLVTASLLVQAVPPMTADDGSQRLDVGFEQLLNGDNQGAVARIQARHGKVTDEPAALINLGRAYARMGDVNKAADCYRLAIASRTRYDLELADGRWMDSRDAARAGMAQLNTRQALASR
jgi:tetratricopeptide (TPR) repeat protein